MSAAITARHDFCAFAGDNMNTPLFSINEGVPAIIALEAASCMLSVAQELLLKAADQNGLDQSTAFALAIIVDQAKASMDAAWQGIEGAQQ
jgi:hypothetical protein